MRQRLPVRLCALAAALSVLVASCNQVSPAGLSAAPGSVPAGPSGGNLRIGQATEIVSLDPWNVSDAASVTVGRQIFETLVGHDAGLKIVPRLATRWEASADGRAWTFTLREGVRFHDGTAFDAAAVAFNFERARDPGHPARGKRGEFTSFAARWSPDGQPLLTKVTALDARTVVFTLRSAFGPFLADLANPAFAIVSPRTMLTDPDGWMLPGSRAAAGTGPFRFAPGAWQREQLVLERSADHWQTDERGAPLPYLDRITFRAIADAGTRTAELRSGALDVAPDLPTQELVAVRGSPNLAILGRPSLGVVALDILQTRPPYDRPEVRRAIAMAINKQAVAQAVFAGDARLASQMIPPGMLGHDDSVAEFYRYDEAAAKRLLAEAGLARGFETELSYRPASPADEPDTRRMAAAIAADLARVGIKVLLRPLDADQSGRSTDDQRSPLHLAERSAASADPDDLLVPWSDPQARSLLRQARIETGDPKRAEIYKQVSKMLQQQVPRIPLLHPSRPVATSKKVQGLLPHATGGEAFTRVSFAR